MRIKDVYQMREDILRPDTDISHINISWHELNNIIDRYEAQLKARRDAKTAVTRGKHRAEA